MLNRDSTIPAHSQISSTLTLTSRRRRSISTSKRSHSPRVSFAAAPLSSDAKGVKNITRKVIKTLEGLGHLDTLDMCEPDDNLDSKYDAYTEHPEEEESLLCKQANVTMAQVNKGLDGLVGKISNGIAIAEDKEASTVGKSTSVREHGDAQPKIDWEIPRKALHSSIGFFTIYLYISEGNVETIVLVLWMALAIIVPADVLRLRHRRFERLYERLFGFLMRENEKKSTNGVIWYILGVNFVLSLYPQDVATVSILILSWADTAASTIGRLFGSRSPRLPPSIPFLSLPLAPRKSVAGFIAAAITGACIAIGFWGWVAPLRNDGANVSWWWDDGVCTASALMRWSGPAGVRLGSVGSCAGLSALGIVAGIVSGVAEALDLGPLDDNLTLPVISGGCILGFLKLLGFLSPH